MPKPDHSRGDKEIFGDHWIKQALGKHPGKLHRELHVPQDQPIPESKLKSAIAKGGKVGKRAQAVENVKHVPHPGGHNKD
jgi:hypothetical protein